MVFWSDCFFEQMIFWAGGFGANSFLQNFAIHTNLIPISSKLLETFLNLYFTTIFLNET